MCTMVVFSLPRFTKSAQISKNLYFTFRYWCSVHYLPQFSSKCSANRSHLYLKNRRTVFFSQTKNLNSTKKLSEENNTNKILKGSITGKILEEKLPSQKNETKLQEDFLRFQDEKNKNKDQDTWYSGKNAWKFGLASMTFCGFITGTAFLLTFGKPREDEKGKKIPDEFSDLPSWKAYWRRAVKEMFVFKKMIQDPSSEKLLPDPLKDPWFQPPYTLVLEMTGILVHPDWTLSTGWRFKKRPGLKYFLQTVSSPLFEVVIYTHEQGFTALPIIDNMDPEGRIMYKLFRDATKYANGTHLKDLSFLNRDLSKVIMVDCDPKAISLQPSNGFLIKKWQGEDEDRKLIDLANFLKTVAISNIEDVRPVIENYSQFDDPLDEFKKRQQQLASIEEEKQKQMETQKKKSSFLSTFSKRI